MRQTSHYLTKKWSFTKFMAEIDLKTYEFSVTVLGTGRDVDEAFANALDNLSVDPHGSITDEVVYVIRKSDDETEEPKEEEFEN
jgi:carbamoylphosphate synthase large subunit